MLQAMNTGHEGSLTTVHANSPRDALSRVETMTLMAGFDLTCSRRTGTAFLRSRHHRAPDPLAGRHTAGNAGDRGRSHGERGDPPPGHLHVRFPHGLGQRRPFARPTEGHRSAPTPHREIGRPRRQGRPVHLRARERNAPVRHQQAFHAQPVGLASMTATTTGWDHTILVHLERLRSPLGVVLLVAAFSLLLALLLIRQRRQRNLASVRGRTAVSSTYTASARRRQALEEAQNEQQIRHRPGRRICPSSPPPELERDPGRVQHLTYRGPAEHR